jgi:hypothetical protein
LAKRTSKLPHFGPAPAYASKSALENRIQYLFKQFVAPAERSYETGANWLQKYDLRQDYLAAKQKGDAAAMQAAAQKLAALGVTSKSIQKLQPGAGSLNMFQRLAVVPDVQRQLLLNMDKGEFQKYIAKASKKVRSDPQIQALSRRYSASP